MQSNLMKKLILSLTFFCIYLSISAQDQASITAIWKEKPVSGNTEIGIYTVENGKIQKDDSAVRIENSDGSYTFKLADTRPNIRFIGSPSQYFPVYISDNQNITIELANESLNIAGTVSPENRALIEWVSISRPVYNNMITRIAGKDESQEFFERFAKMVNQAGTLIQNLNTGNAEFDAKFKRAIGYATDLYALSYRMNNSAITQKDLPEYYKTILTPGKFDDALVLDMPFGERYLALFKTYTYMDNGGSDMDVFMKLIGSPALRNKLLYDDLKYLLSAYEMRRAIDNYAGDLDEANIEALKEKLSEIVALNNTDTQDFTFPDIDGNQISLSDFRGKVVLIDVWATWCGPCMYQLPYLLQLEEKFHNNPDLIVMGISVDKQKDYDKWAEMVRNGQVKGIQLFANNDREFSNNYKIKGIPRFMIVGRDGKIVEYNSPRPSSPLLEELLKELLES